MVEWIKVGTDVIVGGAVGAVDQVIQNMDEKRAGEAIAKGEKEPGILAQYGTYLNYGVPILGILLAALGVLKGDWATRVVTAGSVLAGKKLTSQVTKKKAVAWTGWQRQSQQEAQQRAALEAQQRAVLETRKAESARAQVGTGNAETIPIISGKYGVLA